MLIALGILVAGGVGLAVIGVATVRNSTAGRFVDPLPGPDEPGYQAYVEPTPTMAVVHRGAEGELIGVALLVLESNEDGGTVVLVPATTLIRQDPDEEAPATLAEVYDQLGDTGVVAALGDLLVVAIPEHLEVDDARWASLVAPVAPVEVELTGQVGEWGPGTVPLTADDVGPFLATLSEGEPEVERLERQVALWTAWLPQVRDAGADALPGETGVGIGRFVRELAAGLPSIVPLPVTPVDEGAGGVPEAYNPHVQQVGDLVARAVPSPVSPTPDRRARVRLLNGTTDRALMAEAAQALVRSGAEITIVGNAQTFDEEETRLLYGSEAQRPAAEWLAAGFGDATVEADPSLDGGETDDDIDVTVILGDDARDLIGR